MLKIDKLWLTKYAPEQIMPNNNAGIPSTPLLQEVGDANEQRWWPELRVYLPKYETLWRMHVYPLRCQDSILLREGIDECFERFAINHYSGFLNLARAFEKIENRADDFAFPEEIWSHLQRAIEVSAEKAEPAFSEIHRKCTHTDSGVDTTQMFRLKASIG